MRIYSIYFSPTGGTEKAVEAMAKMWDTPVSQVDLCDPSSRKLQFHRDDICLIGVPSYGGRVPAVALERLKQLYADGTAAVLVSAYGNRDFDDTLLELQAAAEGCGFRPVAAVAAVTEHSIIRQYGTGRPDPQDVEELQQFARRIRDRLESGAAGKDLNVPGKRPFREYKGVPLKPAAGKACTGCGACAAKCPVGAIPQNQPNETDTERCISCMRCIKVCPVEARSLNKALLFAAGQKLKKACAGRKQNKLFLAGGV